MFLHNAVKSKMPIISDKSDTVGRKDSVKLFLIKSVWGHAVIDQEVPSQRVIDLSCYPLAVD